MTKEKNTWAIDTNTTLNAQSEKQNIYDEKIKESRHDVYVSEKQSWTGRLACQKRDLTLG